MTETRAGRRVEPVAVVLDHQAQRPFLVRPDPDRRTAGAGVSGDVAQRLVDDAQEMGRHDLVRLGVDGPGLQFDVDDRIVPELLDHGAQPLEQRRPGQELRLEPEDEVPDVADGQVEAVDRALDPSLDLVGVLADELRDVLQRQSDGVDALDDPIVQVPADALALVDDRQALDLLEQACVLDGDPGMERERLDERAGRPRRIPARLPCRSGTGSRRIDPSR